MDQADIDRFGTQRAAEVAAPLLTEIFDRLGLDIDTDNRLALRMLADFGNRLFAAGYNFGVMEASARFLERLPAEVKVEFVSPDLPKYGPLGGEAGSAGLDPDAP